MDAVFYDVTTFYFESEVEKEGELRQMGFGKNGKIVNTQILFCMMIDRDKNPTIVVSRLKIIFRDYQMNMSKYCLI